MSSDRLVGRERGARILHVGNENMGEEGTRGWECFQWNKVKRSYFHSYLKMKGFASQVSCCWAALIGIQHSL
jgi:hypothetical protein